jgi:hypothetical protein
MLSRRIACAAVLGLAAAAAAQEGLREKDLPHVIFTPADVKWVAAPPSFRPGVQFAVLHGDPSKPGPFTIRAKLPAGYKLMPHWHPTTEHQTVLEGTYSVGRGDRFDMAALHALPAGSFSVMPAEMRHFGYTKDGVVLQVHGIGPFTVNYVDPADDPRNAVPPAN